LKARYFTHYIAIGDLLESVVSLLTHYICYRRPFWKHRTCTVVAITVPLKADTMQLLLGTLVKHSNYTLQLLGGPWKAE